MDEPRAGWRTFGEADEPSSPPMEPSRSRDPRTQPRSMSGGWAGLPVGGRAWEAGPVGAGDAAIGGAEAAEVVAAGGPPSLMSIVPLALSAAAGAVAAAALLLVLGTSASSTVVVDAAASPGSTEGIGAVRSSGDVVATDGASEPSGAVADGLGETSIVVDVEGAVPRPGLTRLPAGARVGDAIAAAGGYAPSVDVARAAAEVNLAARVSDGDRIHVPAVGEAPTAGNPTTPSAAPASGTGPGTGLVDLNRASASELDALPGIGPVTAEKILRARAATPFRTVQDLRDRKVVTAATFAKIATLVTVGP